jgi:plastocyanin
MRITTACAAVLLAAVVAGCGNGDETQVGVATPVDGTVTVVALNVMFDIERIEAPPGELTVVLDNQDGGLPHNIRFFEGTDSSGEVVGATPTRNGPVVDTLTLDLEPGEYYFHCDVHPNMAGTLSVSNP